jgi:hypothetical protein
MDQVKMVVGAVSLDWGMQRSRGGATVVVVPGVLEVIGGAEAVVVVAAVVNAAADCVS